MYGYLVNILLPRGGEVVRLVTISRAEKLSVAGVLPTLFIDRILDMAMLALLLGITLFFLPAGLRGAMPWLVPGGIGLCAATALGFIFLPFAGRAMRALLDQKLVQSTISKKLFDKLTELSSQFDAGTKSLTNPIAFPAIGGLSLAIWFCYWLSFYLMIGSFDLFHQVQPGDILIVFAIASAGALVPTPGSAGTFHLLVTQTLVMVSHIDRSLALAVATTLHLFCFVLVICVLAGGCFMLQSLMGKFLGRRQIKTTVQGGSTDR